MKPILTIHLVTSRSMDATEEQRMPYITRKGKKTFKKSQAVRSENREELQDLANKFNLQQGQYGIEPID